MSNFLRSREFVGDVCEGLDNLRPTPLFLEDAGILDGYGRLICEDLDQGGVFGSVEAHHIAVQIQVSDQLVLGDHRNPQPTANVFCTIEFFETLFKSYIWNDDRLPKIVTPLTWSGSVSSPHKLRPFGKAPGCDDLGVSLIHQLN